MSKNVQDYENALTEVEIIKFESIQELYDDLLSNQSFILSQNTYSGDFAILEGYTIYRHVELKRGNLHFHGNKFGGSEIAIMSKISSMEKLSTPNVHISEYKFSIDGLEKPFTLMTCKKSLH